MKNYKDINSFKDACKVEGLDPKKVVPDFSFFPKNDQKGMQALCRLVIATRAANRLANDGIEWIADYNASTPKYDPYFYLRDKDDGSSGFRLYDYGHWATYSRVGSRLCFINEAVLKHITEVFIEDYENWYLKK